MAKAPEAGYSGTPLVKKLGYKPGQAALMVGVPKSLRNTLTLPDFDWCQLIDDPQSIPENWPPLDVIHLFTDAYGLLQATLPLLRGCIRPSGMIWVSWPKKASKVPTDVTEDRIRSLALAIDLVDVKVCAVDQVWSGLKLVIPLAKRPG